MLAEEETGKQTANKDNISSGFILLFKASIKSFGTSEHKVIMSGWDAFQAEGIKCLKT